MKPKRTVIRETGLFIPKADFYSTPEGRRMKALNVAREQEKVRPRVVKIDTEDYLFRPELQGLVFGASAWEIREKGERNLSTSAQ